MSDEREELAAAQTALVRALVQDGSAPLGFDHDRLAATRAMLARKRAAQRPAAPTDRGVSDDGPPSTWRHIQRRAAALWRRARAGHREHP